MKIDPMKYSVWTSVSAYTFGASRRHLARVGEERTLCGKRRGNMHENSSNFDLDNDCRKCAESAAKEMKA